VQRGVGRGKPKKTKDHQGALNLREGGARALPDGPQGATEVSRGGALGGGRVPRFPGGGTKRFALRELKE